MTPTETVTPTPTITLTPTVTPTVTTTPYSTVTPTATETPTPTVTQTVTPTLPIVWDGVLVFQPGGPSTVSTPAGAFVDFQQFGTYIAGISCFYQLAGGSASFPTLASYTLSTFVYDPNDLNKEGHQIFITISNASYYGKLFAIKYPDNWWTVYGNANQGKPYTNGTPMFIRGLEGNVSRIMMRDSYFNK
jgi:hypothetical protein